MILLTFWDSGMLWLGIKTNRGVLDLREMPRALSDQGVPTTIDELFNGNTGVQERLESTLVWALKENDNGPWLLEESTLQFGPCISRPEKIICVGLNYQAHATESKTTLPKDPVLFAKFSNTLAAHNESIPLPEGAREIDYEAELGVVIGKQGKNLAEHEALDHVFGYCNANDLSARDLQFRSTQWLLGKTPDKFLPVGPYLVTANEIPNPQDLRLRTWVNGSARQDAVTKAMLFPVASLIAYISRYITLEPGDLILTGTPEGVILGEKEPKWLVSGDQIDIEISGLGRLTNVIE